MGLELFELAHVQSDLRDGATGQHPDLHRGVGRAAVAASAGTVAFCCLLLRTT